MKKKEIILDIARELYLTKENVSRGYIYINNKDKYNKVIKNKSKFKNTVFAIIDFKKFNFSDLFHIFVFMNKYFRIYKNFLIFFDLKKEIIAHNFFPDWPGKYKFSNDLKSLFFWLKQIFSNFLFFKKISYIVIKFK